MSVASLVTRGLAFGGIPALVTHGLESAVAPTPTPTPTPTPSGLLGGGGDPWHYHVPYRRDEEERLSKEIAYKEREADLKRTALRKEIQDTETLSRNLEALDASIREEINRLSKEKAALIRRIDDEEAMLILMLSSPFI